MITFYKTDSEGQIQPVDHPVKGCWINVTDPTIEEKEQLLQKYHIVPEFLRAALDEEESSYIDHDEEGRQTLVIVDYPEVDMETSNRIQSFITLPISILFSDQYIFTICTRKNSTIKAMQDGKVKGLDTRYKTRFLLQLLLLISQEYLADLRLIERISEQTEAKLYKRMRNQELIDMLILDKSLVYFSTSLKAEQLTIERLKRGKEISMYDEDRELLDDVNIEIKQAVEMCEIYSDISTRTSDGFTNVINNNMNDVMKRLTVLTLVLSIPNMVYGFYGMNVQGLPLPYCWFPAILSLVIALGVWIYLKHNSGYRS